MRPMWRKRIHIINDQVITYEDDDEDEETNKDGDDKKETLRKFVDYISMVTMKLGDNVVKKGNVDLKEAKKLVDSLKTKVADALDVIGKTTETDVHDIIADKYNELKKFVDSDEVKENLSATRMAAAKFGETLVNAVKKIKEAGEDAAKESKWTTTFKREVSKVKDGLERKWSQIKNKWEKIVNDDDGEKEKYEEEKTTGSYDTDEQKRKDKYKKKKKYIWKGADDEEEVDETYEQKNSDDEEEVDE